MSVTFGAGTLALAVLLGGFVAFLRGEARKLMGPTRSFAVVAAAAIALFHLLPEAVDRGGWRVLVGTALGLALPALLERFLPAHGGHSHQERAPTTALAIGYSAVLAHQFGEGAVVGTLARAGALEPGLVLALSAHTVPLAMVVAMGILEAKGPEEQRPYRAIWLALGGISGATVVGALLGNTLGEGPLGHLGPWMLAVVAGLLLHTLAHDARPRDATTGRARAMDAAAGLGGLLVAIAGLEKDSWLLNTVPELRWTLWAFAGAIALWRSMRLGPHDDHRGHGHDEPTSPQAPSPP